MFKRNNYILIAEQLNLVATVERCSLRKRWGKNKKIRVGRLSYNCDFRKIPMSSVDDVIGVFSGLFLDHGCGYFK